MAWTPKRRRETPERRGWSRRRKLTVAGLVLALVGFGTGYLLATRMFFPGPEPPGDLVQVPDLRGATATEAQEALRGRDLVALPTDSMHHPELPRGEVVAQVPLPGQLSRPGGGVRLTVSLGPESVAVPRVEGLPADRAQAVLETVGFTVVVDSVQADAPPGRVVSSDPAAGAEVSLPRVVVLAVSRGPPRVSMPRVVGLTEDEATAVLDSLGLRVGEVVRVFGSRSESGRVVEQSPEPGTAVERGSAVRITVGGRSPEPPPGEGNFRGRGSVENPANPRIPSP